MKLVYHLIVNQNYFSVNNYIILLVDKIHREYWNVVYQSVRLEPINQWK